VERPEARGFVRILTKLAIASLDTLEVKSFDAGMASLQRFYSALSASFCGNSFCGCSSRGRRSDIGQLVSYGSFSNIGIVMFALLA
jgi:hypothetical protein